MAGSDGKLSFPKMWHLGKISGCSTWVGGSGGGELGGVGKGRVDSYLAGRCFTSRVTTTWLTSIGPPTGRERVGMAQ